MPLPSKKSSYSQSLGVLGLLAPGCCRPKSADARVPMGPDYPGLIHGFVSDWTCLVESMDREPMDMVDWLYSPSSWHQHILAAANSPHLENWTEGAVKLLGSGTKGPFVVKHVFSSPSWSASADQVLIIYPGHCVVQDMLTIVLISLKTFSLDTKGNKGLCILQNSTNV